MIRSPLCRYFLVACVILPPSASAEPSLAERAERLLVRRCLECHGGNDPQGQLDLTSRKSLLAGGESGSAVNRDDPPQSLILERVIADEMPPKKALSAEERELLTAWVQAAAPYAHDPLSPWQFTTPERAGLDWWSLQPLRHVVPPEAVDPPGARSPLDAFHQRDLQAAGLTSSQPAKRQALIRRVTQNLIGLPPTPEDIDDFLDEDRPDAFERLVDRLLASPHYGERWARHWFDVVRYGESNGFERDLPRPNAWHYRDWVIAAFNADLPYAEFVRRQIAEPSDSEGLKSKGFLVAGPHDTVVPVSERMRQTMRFDELEDVLGAVGQAFLGLTVNCARCHDHKFDPVSQMEYYQLSAVFAGVDHGESDFVPPAVAAESATELQTLGDRTAVLAKTGPIKVYTAALSQPGPVHFLKRGNVADPGEVALPSSLAAVSAGEKSFRLSTETAESERRAAFADWLASSDNALATRTIVNRLWHFHFGAGFIETPNDLGFNGGRPSHPELLEWLCRDFVRSGGGLKRFHRQVVTSAAYRQSSQPRPDALAKDAGNRLLWRMTPRRLEAEAVRDAMLAVSGELNETLGGPSYQDFHSYFFKGTQFYDPIDTDDANVHRRTVYRMWARGGRSPFLDTFDCPDPSTTTPKRSVTTTPLQALALLNNAFAIRMSERLAARVDGGANPQAKIAAVYRFAYGRLPEDEEIQFAQEFVGRRGLVEFCRVILNSSEFLYVE